MELAKENEHIIICKELLEESFNEINMSIKIVKQNKYNVIEIYNKENFLVATCYSPSEALGFKKGWNAYRSLNNNDDDLINLINKALT